MYMSMSKLLGKRQSSGINGYNTIAKPRDSSGIDFLFTVLQDFMANLSLDSQLLFLLLLAFVNCIVAVLTTIQSKETKTYGMPTPQAFYAPSPGTENR